MYNVKKSTTTEVTSVWDEAGTGRDEGGRNILMFLTGEGNGH